jgi:hypothetical protein
MPPFWRNLNPKRAAGTPDGHAFFCVAARCTAGGHCPLRKRRYRSIQRIRGVFPALWRRLACCFFAHAKQSHQDGIHNGWNIRPNLNELRVVDSPLSI